MEQSESRTVRIPRIHVTSPLRTGLVIELAEQAADHVIRVLRLERGASLQLFDGKGGEYAGEIDTLIKRVVRVRILDSIEAPQRESPLRITLAQGIARGEKMDWILQKATELGVARIVPLITQRTEVKLDAERAARRVAHWKRVLASACEQCGRKHLPALQEPTHLVEWVASLGTESGLRLVLDPYGDVAVRSLPSLATAVLAVGPEGGLAERDHALLRQADFRGLRLGPRILRTETAGLAALAALQALHGDL